MSDMPKNLQGAAGLRWILLASAALLTVVSGGLGWIEMVYDNSTAPRSFVWGIALVAWIGWITLCCTVFVCKRLAAREARLEKRAERNTVRIIEAICEKRLANLADLMEEDNIRPINGKR